MIKRAIIVVPRRRLGFCRLLLIRCECNLDALVNVEVEEELDDDDVDDDTVPCFACILHGNEQT